VRWAQKGAGWKKNGAALRLRGAQLGWLRQPLGRWGEAGAFDVALAPVELCCQGLAPARQNGIKFAANHLFDQLANPFMARSIANPFMARSNRSSKRWKCLSVVGCESSGFVVTFVTLPPRRRQSNFRIVRVSDDVIETATRYAASCTNKSRCHFLAAERNKAKNLWLGIPTTIITTLVATSVFGTLAQKGEYFWLSVITGACSILAAVLSGLQTFLRFSESSQEHKSAAIAYQFLLSYADGTHRDASLAELKTLVQELNEIDKLAPTIPDSVFDEVERRYAMPESMKA
jgi:hypothetical protein